MKLVKMGARRGPDVIRQDSAGGCWATACERKYCGRFVIPNSCGIGDLR